MTKTLTRRAVVAGTVAAAIASPAKAKRQDAEWEAKKLTWLGALQNAEAMEVTGDNMRPFGKGTLVLVKPGEARPNDVVLIRCKTGQQFLAQLVHKDQGRAYLRGLKTGDRMQAVKLAKIAGMSRVVASLYP